MCTKKRDYKTATVTEKKLEEFGGIKVSIYTLPQDEDNVYAFLTTPKGSFSLGSIGTYNYRKPGDISIESVLFSKEKVMKITGGVGANHTLSSYYRIDAKGAPEGLLQVETGFTREMDVDRDGLYEVLAAHGLPMTAYVYRWNGELLKKRTLTGFWTHIL